MQLIANSICPFERSRDIFGIVHVVNNDLALPMITSMNGVLKAGSSILSVDCRGIAGCNDQAFATGSGLIVELMQNGVEDSTYSTGYNRSNY